MLGLNGGEFTLVALLVFAVVSARFWPAAGARVAERLAGHRPDRPGDPPAQKSQRTNDTNST